MAFKKNIHYVYIKPNSPVQIFECTFHKRNKNAPQILVVVNFRENKKTANECKTGMQKNHCFQESKCDILKLYTSNIGKL